MIGRAVSVPGQERRGRRRPPGRADVVQGRRAGGHREFSMAVVQANNLLEDQSQVESGPLSMAEPSPHGTFVGVYDVHGGPETSWFVNDNMFHHLKRFATEHKCMSADVIRKAFQAKTASSRWSTRNGLGSLRLQR